MRDETRSAVRVVSAEIKRGDTYLLVQRGPNAVLPLLWEFPGGRVRAGESESEALIRAVRGRIGVSAAPRDRILEVSHAYDEYDVTLVVYRCEIGPQEPIPVGVAQVAWVLAEDLADYPFPDADQKTIDQLLSDPAG